VHDLGKGSSYCALKIELEQGLMCTMVYSRKVLHAQEYAMMQELRDDRPLVSIIIDNYNYGRFLQDAIESALNQTYPNIEVIVVDDGSTDNSREIIGHYVDAGLIKAVLKENGGQASAMNAGFKVSNGDLVVFLDADDVLRPEAIETAVNAWQPGVSKVQWRLQLTDNCLRPLGVFSPPLEARLANGDIRKLMYDWFEYPASAQSGNIYARSFLLRVMPLPPEDWRICADTPLLKLAPFFGEIISLTDVLTYYRMHNNNNSMLVVDPPSFMLFASTKIRKYLAERSPEQYRLLKHEVMFEKKMKLILDLMGKEANGSYRERVARGLSGAVDSLFFPFFTSFGKRVLSFGWFVLVALLPVPLARRIARIATAS